MLCLEETEPAHPVVVGQEQEEVAEVEAEEEVVAGAGWEGRNPEQALGEAVFAPTAAQVPPTRWGHLVTT